MRQSVSQSVSQFGKGMSAPVSGHSVIGAVEAEREQMAARLAALDDLLVKLRVVFPAPAAPVKDKAVASSTPRRLRQKPMTGIEAPTDDNVRSALRTRGPLSPGEFASVFGFGRNVVKARQVVRDLEARGIVVVSGTTASRRIALPGLAAKEVPEPASPDDDAVHEPPPLRHGPGRPRRYDPRLRQVDEQRPAARGASWWAQPSAQQSREGFNAAAKARDLVHDPNAAKVKAKMNFVE